jgi:hypothetical protein
LFFLMKRSISPMLDMFWSASLEISSATTANPLPALPARAGRPQIAALSERRFILSEISFIMPVTVAISLDLSLIARHASRAWH